MRRAARSVHTARAVHAARRSALCTLCTLCTLRVLRLDLGRGCGAAIVVLVAVGRGVVLIARLALDELVLWVLSVFVLCSFVCVLCACLCLFEYLCKLSCSWAAIQ